MCLWLCLRTFILFNVTIYYFTSFSKNDLVANEVGFIWFCRLVCKLKAIGEKLQALNKLKYSLPLFPVSIVNTSTHIQKCQKKMSLVKLFHGVWLFSGSSRTVMWTICNMVVFLKIYYLYLYLDICPVFYRCFNWKCFISACHSHVISSLRAGIYIRSKG